MRYVLWVTVVLFSFSAQAQKPAANPAVTNRNLLPDPLEKVGSVFSMTFLIGNNSSVSPLTGVSDEERMGFYVELNDCKPFPANEKALTGPLLEAFDVSYEANSNRFTGRQKTNTKLGKETLLELVIKAIVTQASSTTNVNSIGALCRILPNANSLSTQPTYDDQLEVYTHTRVAGKAGSLGGFTVQARGDRTVAVNWRSERQKKKFVIERSKDLKNYESVGQVGDEAASQDSLSQYSFTDSRPYRGTSYYRLRQIDANGQEQTLTPIPVVIDTRYEVLPNPVPLDNQTFVVSLDDPQSAVLHLFTSKGEEVKLTKGESGESMLKLSPADKLARGIYLLTVEERGQTRQHRFLIR